MENGEVLNTRSGTRSTGGVNVEHVFSSYFFTTTPRQTKTDDENSKRKWKRLMKKRKKKLLTPQCLRIINDRVNCKSMRVNANYRTFKNDINIRYNCGQLAYRVYYFHIEESN